MAMFARHGGLFPCLWMAATRPETQALATLSQVQQLRMLSRGPDRFSLFPRRLGLLLRRAPDFPSSQGVLVRNKSVKQYLGETSSLVTWRAVGIVLSVVAMLSFGVRQYKKDQREKREKAHKKMFGKALIGGPFELVDVNGKVRTSESFKGAWLLIYFGFTHCPDVCPDQLDKLTEALNTLGKSDKLPRVVPLFITVDPERDSPEKIKEYLKDFHKDFIGLTGTHEQIDKACKAYRVYYSSSPKVDDDYIVDHTIICYLVGPNGKFQEYFGQNKSAEDMCTSIRSKMLNYYLEDKEET